MIRRANLGGFDRALVAIALFAALGWWLAGAFGAAAGPVLALKVAVMPTLAAVAVRRRKRLPGGGLLAAALVLHGAGDLLLELSFLAGLSAFLAGHCVYTGLFWSARRPIEEAGGGLKAGLGALALFGALFVSLLAPRLDGAVGIAVPLYVVALLAMAATALLARRGQPVLTVGACAFVVSDSLLAVELFLGGFPGGRQVVWPLYVAGQLAIALGWLGGRDDAG